MLVLEDEADSRRDVLRQRRHNDKHCVYDRVFGEDSTQVRLKSSYETIPLQVELTLLSWKKILH